MEFTVGDKLECCARPAGERKAWYTIGNLYEITGKGGRTRQFLLTCDSNDSEILFEQSDIEKYFECSDEPQKPQNASEATVLKVGTRLRYKGASNKYEFNGEYEVTDVSTLESGKVLYDIGERFADEWERDELLEHFDVIGESLLEKNASEKIKLRPEVIEALENALKENKADDLINIHAYAIISGKAWTHDEAALNQLSVADLARALFVGYDVEQSPEEEILKVWQSHNPSDTEVSTKEYDYLVGYRRGMKKILRVYGIKVKGIND